MAKRKIKSNIKLREKKLADGFSSLYLDYYHRGKRQYKFLKLYVKTNPKTASEKIDYDENYRMAEQIRQDEEKRVISKNHNIEIANTKNGEDFFDYLQQYLQRYPNKDIRLVKSTIKHFRTFAGVSSLPFFELDENLLLRYKQYLDKNFNGETPYNYFSKMKTIIKSAHKEGYIPFNYAEDIRNTRNEGLKKDILTLDEISQLAKTECGSDEIKRAFLFCLNTGLRFCDVSVLKWSNISGEMLIIKGQSKTGKPVYVHLNHNAKNVLKGHTGNYDEPIFNLPTLSSALRTLKIWTKRAGINKNITWHSARHSIAVNLLTLKHDIKSVSSILGHSKIAMTEKYLHVVDELKKNAVNSLPEI